MKKLVPVILLVALAAAVYGWRQRGVSSSNPPAAPVAGAPAVSALTPVEVMTVNSGVLTREVTVVGSLRSNESVTIRPEIAGRIARLDFKEGQRVNKGTLLLVLDDAVYRAEMAQAQASLDRSQRLRNSGKKLFADNYISNTEMDALATAVKVDESAVALAQARLNKTRLTAPFDGVLGLRQVSVGDYLNPGQDIVNIEDITPIKLDFRVPESYLSELAVGQPLAVHVDAYADQSFSGSVIAIDPLISAEDRSIAVRGEIKNDDLHLRPGLFARVRLVLSERADAITVPEQAVVSQQDGHYVYRVVDGKALRTPVETGQRQAGRVEVRSGLKVGDTLVTAGHLKLTDGKPVQPAMNPKILEETQPAAAP